MVVIDCCVTTSSTLTRSTITVLDIGFPVAGLAFYIEGQSRRTFYRCQSRDAVFSSIIASKFDYKIVINYSPHITNNGTGI